MKRFFLIAAALFLMVAFTGCFSYTAVVGSGPVEYKKDSRANHYFLYGLIPANVSDSKKLAHGAENYEIQTRQTFVNGLIYGVTLGIYCPTKTTVTR
jgi:hypothetical protein